MDLLVLGGTQFLGRHFVEAARSSGHRLTLFHRGKTGADLFPDAEHVLGDRATDLDRLGDRRWDAVVDTCGYFPRIVRASAEALRGRVGRYLFVSTISVYSELGAERITEDSPLGVMDDPSVEEITGETYGPLKVLCEEAVRETHGEGAIVVRPGLIVGPHDPTDRFSYWPVRMARGGRVLVPDRPEQPVQIIDGRDLAAWMLRLVEAGRSGTYNATGPQVPYRLGEFVETIRDAVNPQAELVPVPVERLEAEGVAPWGDLPCVLPYDGSLDGMARVDVSRAVATGLTFRPLADTARDTLSHLQQREGGETLRTGLAPEREAQILGTLS